jgi:hypothetical protein
MSRIIDEIVEDIYEQLSRDNEGLDPLIKEVKLVETLKLL